MGAMPCTTRGTAECVETLGENTGRAELGAVALAFIGVGRWLDESIRPSLVSTGAGPRPKVLGALPSGAFSMVPGVPRVDCTTGMPRPGVRVSGIVEGAR